MRKRKAGAPKVAAKEVQPARKSAAKSSPATPSEALMESVTPKIVETKRVAAMRANQMKKSQTTTPVDSKPGQLSGEEIEVSPSKKFVKATQSFVRRAPLKTKMGELEEAVREKVENLSEEVEVYKVAEVVEEEPSQHTVENTREFATEEGNVIEAKDHGFENTTVNSEEQSESTELEVTCSENAVNALVKENELPGGKEEAKDGEDNNTEHDNIGENDNVELELEKEDTEHVKRVDDLGEGMGEEKVDLGENEDEIFLENVDANDHAEQTKALQDGEREYKAIAKERRNRKEREVFVGGAGS